ncbi:MAG TPA: RDD family protein [Steroidobacteraceae bacterium]|nr:RDD family protein [Steroidobacteraceae bacterium]
MSVEESVSHVGADSAGLLRRFAAIFYDLLLIIAVLMTVTWLLLPLTRGEAITRETVGAFEYLYRALLLALVVAYFGFSWTRSGETVGMLAWKIRVVRRDGSALRWRDVLLRLAAAMLSWLPAGLGYFWMLVDRDRLTWHDRLSETRVIRAT